MIFKKCPHLDKYTKGKGKDKVWDHLQDSQPQGFVSNLKS